MVRAATAPHWPVAVALAGAIGCAVAKGSPPPGHRPAEVALDIVAATRSCGLSPATGREICDPDGVVTLWGGADYARPGTLFSVMDERGYAGLFRATEQHDCDDCMSPVVFLATRVSGRDPPLGASAVGVGPVAGPLPRASVHKLALGDAESTAGAWHPSLAVDLDGDGRADIELVERCQRSVRVDCAGLRQACSEPCIGARRVGAASTDVSHVRCGLYVPDSEDCIQEEDE
jgi:hypothetical protein